MEEGRYYWPILYQDVAEFCRSCKKCQKFPGHIVTKALMISLPIMSNPFEQMAMDIVGPLLWSKSGKCYILVIIDYATCFPEAIPKHNIDAEHVTAEELVGVFSGWVHKMRFAWTRAATLCQ